jgi:hypothetical protein
MSSPTGILDLFCKETGLAFSPHKYSFLEAGWSKEELAMLKGLSPFEVKPIDEGFKYLGCYLKPNCYSKMDWIWLVKKFEKMIASWSHRWCWRWKSLLDCRQEQSPTPISLCHE